MRYAIVGAILAVFAGTIVWHASAGAPARDDPGSVVASRILAANELIPGATKGYRVVYRTTGQNKDPEVSGGTVYLPAGSAPTNGWPVVSWAHGTSGMTDGCAPNLNGGMADTFNETPILSTYLAQGFAVAATDYIGLGGAGTYEYLAGRAAGHAVLDIVRAGRDIDRTLSRTFVAAGHSIGGQSALAAAQMWSTYAPDIDLRGTLAYAPTSNVEGTIFELARPGVPAMPGLDGLHARLVMILAGLDHERPDLHLTNYLTPHGKNLVTVARAGEQCLGALEAAVTGRAVGDLFSTPLADPPLMAALHDYLTVPTVGHQRPVLLLQGAADQIQPMPTTQLLQQQLQEDGADSQLAVFPDADHFTLPQFAAGDTHNFLTRVLTTH